MTFNNRFHPKLIQMPLYAVFRFIRFPRFIFCLFLAGIALQVHAQTLSRQKITVSYIYNFAKNVEWPNESSLKSFNIGVYGQAAPALMSEFSALAENAKLRSLPILVSQVSNSKNLGSYQLIYLDHVQGTDLFDIYEAIKGKPILIVTMDYPNKQWVMINLVTTESNRLRFEVNQSNLLNQGLRPLPELILNGGTEIDVAKLFREGQASLVLMQKQLQSREKNLEELTTTIQKQEGVNKQLAKQMESLSKDIRDSDQQIEQQKKQIKSQSDEIEKSSKARAQLEKEVQKRTQELTDQQQHLDQITEDIRVSEKRMIELNGTLQKQEKVIEGQKSAIAGLDSTVQTQYKALRYSVLIIVLAIALLATIAIAYRIKRRDNQRLAAQTKDLQIVSDRLSVAKRKAEEAAKAKSEFLSLMSHELRTPLQAIIGYTEVVIDELRFKKANAEIKDLTQVIHSGERLLKLINGVLDLAKIESGRMDITLIEIKLSSLVDEALRTVSPLLEKNKIRVQLTVNDGEELPKADPEKILHILINLLGNACKFSPKGSVTIKALNERNRLYISVADTGIGLTPEQQLHIFDSFRQADSSSTRKFQGSGLGLSISRQFCEMMNGSIRVESELGKGANFIVEIPLPIVVKDTFGFSGVDRNAQSDTTETNSNLGPSIVMVDDDPSFLDVMARTMRREGYQVFTAENAEQGMSLIQQIKPQVITLDLLLPDEHGWLLFEKIKSKDELKSIPIIVISMVDESKGNDKIHAEEYLTKPIRRETLRLAVQKLTATEKKVTENESLESAR